jgi:uncharacterized protein YukE
MKPQRYRTVSKRIHPPEADRIAEIYAQARAAASQDRDKFTQILGQMGSEWEGNQEVVFLDHAHTDELKISNYCNYLAEVEKRFRNIEVTVEVQELIL